MNDTIDNSILRALSELRKGLCISQASAELTELVQAVKDTGKPGELTIKLTVRPVPNAGGEQVQILDKVKAKMPEPPAKATLFFVDDDAGLHRSNPRQMPLFGEQAESTETQQQEKHG